MSLPRRAAALPPRRRLLAGALALAAGGFVTQARPDSGAAELERNVKAAFLYKFLMFTEFPPSAFADPAAPMVIGVLGDDEMARGLARLVAGRAVNRRPLEVRALRENDSAEGLHLLFVGGSDILSMCSRSGVPAWALSFIF